MIWSNDVIDLSSFKKSGNRGHCIFFYQGAKEWDCLKTFYNWAIILNKLKYIREERGKQM